MSGMRVISGKARGHKLRSVPGNSTRPITDRVKESLFNILGADVVSATFLDLFAGTGSVGIEALSRGAHFVRFVDIEQRAIATTRANLKHTRLSDSAEVVRSDAFKYLEREPDQTFDYVYIAPPQYRELWKKAMFSLSTHSRWLAEDAWVIVQIHPVEYEALILPGLREFDQRKYGSTLLLFYDLCI